MRFGTCTYKGLKMSIEDDVKRVLTCTDDVRCTHEDSCYRMAKFIEQILEERKHNAEAEWIMYYTPDWETAR